MLLTSEDTKQKNKKNKKQKKRTNERNKLSVSRFGLEVRR